VSSQKPRFLGALGVALITKIVDWGGAGSMLGAIGFSKIPLEGVVAYVLDQGKARNEFVFLAKCRILFPILRTQPLVHQFEKALRFGFLLPKPFKFLLEAILETKCSPLYRN
jgi:hypothetical protein